MVVQNMNLSISFQSFLVLKYPVIAAFLICWNSLLGIGFYLNGGAGQIEDPVARLLVTLALSGTSLTCFAIVSSVKVRKALLHPERGRDYESPPFVFLGLLSLILAVVSCVIG